MKHHESDAWYYLEELKGKPYNEFLKFAVLYSDYFSLSTFKSVREKDLNKSYLDLVKKISPYEIDTYNFKRMPQHYERGQKIHVYTLNEYTRKLLLNINIEGIYSWIIPSLPEDLSFFKGKKVWFNSISHAKVSKMYNVDDKVLQVISQITSITRISNR